jgi:hypothetical protein
MMETGKVNWARPLLLDILRWMEQNKHVTKKQAMALARIERKGGLDRAKPASN